MVATARGMCLLVGMVVLAAGCQRGGPPAGGGTGGTAAGAAGTDAKPSAGMQWAKTDHFRGEVPSNWVVSPVSIVPDAVLAIATAKSGLTLGAPQTDPKAIPIPLPVTVVLVEPKQQSITVKNLMDTLLGAARSLKVKTDDTLTVDGRTANRVVSAAGTPERTTWRLFVPTDDAVLVVTTDHLTSDFQQFSASLDKFVASLKLSK